MAILSYNEIVIKKVIVYDGQPYKVLSAHVFRMQQRKPVNQTKLQHLVSGRVIEISFHQNESVPEADIERMQATYLYTNRGESWFAEVGNPKNRFSFPDEAVHDKVQWLAQNDEYAARLKDLGVEPTRVEVAGNVKYTAPSAMAYSPMCGQTTSC